VIGALYLLIFDDECETVIKISNISCGEHHEFFSNIFINSIINCDNVPGDETDARSDKQSQPI
jgi:hypothetical protein